MEGRLERHALPRHVPCSISKLYPLPTSLLLHLRLRVDKTGFFQVLAVILVVARVLTKTSKFKMLFKYNFMQGCKVAAPILAKDPLSQWALGDHKDILKTCSKLFQSLPSDCKAEFFVQDPKGSTGALAANSQCVHLVFGACPSMLIQLTLKEPVFELTNDLKSWVKQSSDKLTKKKATWKSSYIVSASQLYCKYDWWL